MGVQAIPFPTEVVSHSLPFPFPILCFIPIIMGFPGPIGNHIPMHISNSRYCPEYATESSVRPGRFTRGQRGSLPGIPVSRHAGLRLQSSGEKSRRRCVESVHPAVGIFLQLEVRRSRRRPASSCAQIPSEICPVCGSLPVPQRAARLGGFALRSRRRSRPSRRLSSASANQERLHDRHSRLSAAGRGLLRRAVCADPVRRRQQRRPVVSKVRPVVDLGRESGERYVLRGSFCRRRSRSLGQLQSHRGDYRNVRLVGCVACRRHHRLLRQLSETRIVAGQSIARPRVLSAELDRIR